MYPADLADLRRQNTEQQNRNNHNNIPICLSLRDNAACCIPLRDLRYLRENNTQEYSIYVQETPMSPADLAELRRQNPKPHELQTVFLCEIMQLAAFLCVICAICGRITRKSTQSICTNETQCLPQISLIIADKTSNHNNHTNSHPRTRTHIGFFKNTSV